MLQKNSNSIRRATICVATALAIVLPGIATAGVFDKAKSRVKTTVTKAGTVVSNVREKRPVANAAKKAGRKLRNAGQKLRNGIEENLPGGHLFDMVKQFSPKAQIEEVVELMQHVNGDYAAFSGGMFGCQAVCANFREDLKDVLGSYLSLVEQVPALNKRQGLVRKIERMSRLVDVVPARALYPMWKSLDGRTDKLKTTAVNIKRMLESLPSLEDVQGFSQDAGGAVCDWANEENHHIAEWIQGELEHVAWGFKSLADVIPDLEVKGEAGAEGGVAVANVTASAGVGLKPTDYIKLILKTVALVPESINWAIKLNILRAKAICQVAN